MGSTGRWRLFFCCVGPPPDNESLLRCCSNKVHPEWAGESEKEGEDSNQEITWPEGPPAHYEKADKQVKEEVEIQVSVALLSLQEEEDPKFPVHTKDHVQTPNLEILAVEEDPLSSLKTEAYVQSSNPDILSGEEEEEEEEKSELVEGGELEFLSLLHFEVQEQSSHLETSVEEPLTFLKTEALVQFSNIEILEKQKLPSLLDTETEVLISDLDIRDAEKTSLSTDTGLNVPTKNRSRNLSGLFSLLDIPGEHEEPLTQKQIAAFNDVFKVFNSTEGNIKMRGLKLILHSVGINVTHQEIREALNRADIDGDGQVNFTDFVTVLTDDQRFAQSMVRPKESIIHDPYSVETLFFEVLTKLVEMSALPMKSEREVVRYYEIKQRNFWRSFQRKSPTDYPKTSPNRKCNGLTYFCQASRLIGLPTSQLLTSLHSLSDTASLSDSPYATIPRSLRTCQDRRVRLKPLRHRPMLGEKSNKESNPNSEDRQRPGTANQ
ncbi:spermatogenesis-associated protein 21-like isoform X3 [Chrysemys picta bellii]